MADERQGHSEGRASALAPNGPFPAPNGASPSHHIPSPLSPLARSPQSISLRSPISHSDRPNNSSLQFPKGILKGFAMHIEARRRRHAEGLEGHRGTKLTCRFAVAQPGVSFCESAGYLRQLRSQLPNTGSLAAPDTKSIEADRQ